MRAALGRRRRLSREGWVVPGSVIAGGDSHTCTYGALGAFGTGLGSTDIAACLASGTFWQAVPGTIRVEFSGAKARFVTGKDLILAVIDEIGVAGGTNMALEFVGEAAEQLSIDELVVPGDDIDTDVLYPGEFLSISDVTQMAEHLFEGLDPTLRDWLGGDTALVVGANFGAGSSREHVPQAMRASRVRFLVGKSFARISYRNCINLGLPALIAPEAAERAGPDSKLRLDLDAGTLDVDGHPVPLTALPPFMTAMFAAGGLVPWMRTRLAARA